MTKQSLTIKQANASLSYMGREIHTRRVKLKEDIKRLSFSTGLSCEDIEKIEQGIDTGNAADILVVCEALGMDYAELVLSALEYVKENIKG